MKRRDFFRKAAITAVGASIINPFDIQAKSAPLTYKPGSYKGKKPKNIIFMVSDGMSSGTLALANLLSEKKYNKTSNWISLYQENKVNRGMMDMASANSMVTDSSAASSSWGGGVRVNNGSVNVSPDGTHNKPILQKFKAAGKSVGCVTTVEITHATPSGFSLSSERRSDMALFATMHLDLGFDVLMGGGNEYFSADRRADKRDLYTEFSNKGYRVVKNRDELLQVDQKGNGPILGIFNSGALPYALDRENDENLKRSTPSLAEMSMAAIEHLKKNKNGFVMQIEGGKVDWGAHANDVGATLYDQLAFDEALGKVIEFAEKDGQTLVIFTTDHGNSNPGMFDSNDKKFDYVINLKHTNDWILQGIDRDFSVGKIQARIKEASGIQVSSQEALNILSHYVTERNEDGLYNPYKLPFHDFAKIQGIYTGIGWGGTNHSSDYVEVASFGIGREILPAFIKNTDMHQLLLDVSGIPSKFRV